METWCNIWTITLLAGLGIFVVLAIVVAIGGFFDIRSLFKSIENQHKHQKNEKTNKKPQ